MAKAKAKKKGKKDEAIEWVTNSSDFRVYSNRLPMALARDRVGAFFPPR